ncbi:hypothetical protein EPR50_G00015440 [Perca flavescens]|uniref:THAP domain-containing protein 1 n=1 Tax=Perca flavescens TaxID=8167 RepID=A0A484DNK4_PERFV|nr:THAP domain-containing protein 4-like isoform X2 [Perca flavescens]TDH16007.1 hypothetical protein EPR50_G00015440 [Perca flavescens]
MGVRCIVKSCDNKQGRPGNTMMFHRFPTKNADRLNQWLLALDMDPNTPVATFKTHRVCSEHFTEDDYYEKMELSTRTMKLVLKDTAIPSIIQTGQSGSPAATLHGTWAGMDQSPGQVRSTGIQANVPETSTATMEKPTLQHIVDEEAILQLMKNCPMCNRNCRCTKRTRSPYFIVYQSCYYCNYQRKWANQPEARNMDIRNKKLKPTNKVSVNAKAQSSQLNNKCISES